MEVALINGLFVRMAGRPERTTLILLHAFADSGFTPLFDTGLASRFRLVVADLAGFGASPSARRADAICRARAIAGSQRCDLAGPPDAPVAALRGRLSPRQKNGRSHSRWRVSAGRALDRLRMRAAADGVHVRGDCRLKCDQAIAIGVGSPKYGDRVACGGLLSTEKANEALLPARCELPFSSHRPR